MFKSVQGRWKVEWKIRGDLWSSPKEDQKMEKRMVTCKFLTFFCLNYFFKSFWLFSAPRLNGKFDKKNPLRLNGKFDQKNPLHYFTYFGQTLFHIFWADIISHIGGGHYFTYQRRNIIRDILECFSEKISDYLWNPAREDGKLPERLTSITRYACSYAASKDRLKSFQKNIPECPW